jgi:hypothetical protein
MRFISDDTEANRRIDMRSFTARDVQLILSNPVYVGIGKYERIIHDDKWIQTALREASENGASFWLDVQMNVIEFLDLSEKKAATICVKAPKKYDAAKDENERCKELKTLLADLRAATK